MCTRGRRVALIRPNPEKVMSKFLLYYFLTPVWRAKVESNIITGATVDRLPIEKFPTFEVDIPTVAMQAEIVKILEPYDSLIENNKRRIELLEESARLLYKEWFVNLRFPPCVNIDGARSETKCVMV